jgi:S-formylglutathione hydrolase FrmB
MHGWLPVTVQVIAAVVLIAAVSRRSGRWQVRWLPWALIVGTALAASAYWYVASQGLSDNPAPHALWIWVGLTGFAAAVLVAGWRRSGWWRRGVSLAALPLTLLCAGLALNLWVGYFPTVQTAWNQLTAGPLPDQTDQVTVMAMQQERKIPPKGTVVPVDISDAASGFRHRGELVYLPPAWFATNPAPKLPTLMMIGGEFNTPADWLRTGGAVKMLDDFAAAHHGNAPVVVFVDPGGAFNNDTECVNGSRGNSADHLTKDVVPYMVSHYGVSADRSKWGIVGWSMGGTCAVDLAVMHPDMFSAFEDIAGDIGPNSGNKDQTIARLFGGNGDHSTRQERPGCGRELVVRPWRRQRDQLRRREPAGQARLAVRIARVRRCPAMAGRPDRHPRRAADALAGSGREPVVRTGRREVAGEYGGGMPDEPNPQPAPADSEPAAELQPQPPSPPPAEAADTGYTPGGVPTFESVREKIETRYGTAIGASELAAETPEGRSAEEQYEERQRAAAERLEQIRQSMHTAEGESQ